MGTTITDRRALKAAKDLLEYVEYDSRKYVLSEFHHSTISHIKEMVRMIEKKTQTTQG